METKKDMKVAEKEILQETVTTPATQDLQENEMSEPVQRNFLTNLSVYNTARKTLKKNGIDYNVLMEGLLKLICKDEGYDYALLQGKLVITTNLTNNVQDRRQEINPPVQNQGLRATEKKPRNSSQ